MSILAMAFVMAIMLSAGCSPHIGGYSEYEIADTMARQYSVE